MEGRETPPAVVEKAEVLLRRVAMDRMVRNIIVLLLILLLLFAVHKPVLRPLRLHKTIFFEISTMAAAYLAPILCCR